MAAKRLERLARQYLWWTAIALLAVFVLVVARAAWIAEDRMDKAYTLRIDAEKERDQLIQRKGDLGQSLERLKTPRGVEAEVRSRFQLVKPGEEEFIIIDDALATNTPKETSAASIWGWLSALFH